MARLSAPVQVTTQVAEIENIINQIESVLAGNVDIDNIYRTTPGYNSTGFANLPAQSVQDIASSVRPIAGTKLFGNAVYTASFENAVLDPLIELTLASTPLRVVSKKQEFTFTKKSNVKTVNNTIDMYVELPPNMVPIMYERLNSILLHASTEGGVITNIDRSGREDQTYVVTTCFQLSKKLSSQGDNDLGRRVATVYLQNVTIDEGVVKLTYRIEFHGVQIDDDNDYFTVILNPLILCEVF